MSTQESVFFYGKVKIDDCVVNVFAHVTDLNAFLNAGADAEICVRRADTEISYWVQKGTVDWQFVRSHARLHEPMER